MSNSARRSRVTLSGGLDFESAMENDPVFAPIGFKPRRDAKFPRLYRGHGTLNALSQPVDGYRSRFQFEKLQLGFGILALIKAHFEFRDEHFEGRPYDGAQYMTACKAAVGLSYTAVDV